MSPIFSALDTGRTKKRFPSRSSTIAQLVKIPDSCSGTDTSLCCNVRGFALRILFNIGSSFHKMQGSFRGPKATWMRFCALFVLSCELYDHSINSRKGYLKISCYFALTKTTFMLTHDSSTQKF